MNIWFLDNWLIGKCEKFTHWFQRQTGKTNYFLCKMFSCAILLVAVVELTLKQWDWLNVFMIILISAFIVYRIPKEEEKAYKRIQDGVANPYKANLWDRLVRLVIWFMFLYSAVLLILFLIAHGNIVEAPFIPVFIGTFYGLFFLLLFHFYACDPLPPCRGKLWDKIGALLAKPAISNVQG